jgi:hypothetical protein
MDPHQSHLFTLRIWPEASCNGQIEWRIQVQVVPSGEAGYFQNWETPVGHLLALLPDVRAAGPVEAEGDERE